MQRKRKCNQDIGYGWHEETWRDNLATAEPREVQSWEELQGKGMDGLAWRRKQKIHTKQWRKGGFTPASTELSVSTSHFWLFSQGVREDPGFQDSLRGRITWTAVAAAEEKPDGKASAAGPDSHQSFNGATKKYIKPSRTCDKTYKWQKCLLLQGGILSPWEYQNPFQWKEDKDSAWQAPVSTLWPRCSSQHFWMSAARQRQQHEEGHSSSPSHQALTNSDPLHPRPCSYPCKWLWFGSFYSHPATVWKVQGAKHGRITTRITSSLKEPGFLFFRLYMRSEKGSCPLVL